MMRNRCKIELGESGFISVAICEKLTFHCHSTLFWIRFSLYYVQARASVIECLALSQHQGTSHRIMFLRSGSSTEAHYRCGLLTI